MAVRLALVASAVTAVVALGIEALTHLVAPRLLSHYERAPQLATIPKRTTNAKGLAGDPLNVALVGTETDIDRALRAAGWVRADSLDRATSIGIAKSVLLHRPDSAAPVSPLFLFGRQQNVAYEREVGRSASRRHHVRLWSLDARAAALTDTTPHMWIGSATFDRRAGISRRGLHPTHHIGPDIDQERDTLVANLAQAGQLTARFEVTGMGVRVNDHNAEGDRFDTDGELVVAVLAHDGRTHPAPAMLDSPRLVAWKNALWGWVHALGGPSASR